ncbi:hypothetical protein MVES_002716 [Malassezia vespertilionis]|uniref:Uncharacterized protein n=1 Tax=Malassezia vespertilionis TaxID=2020962 RepID=A0A2N1JB01_9BASI|nr:hypothetical protein MVES_002716 [Malassezia vespertilionis]
MAGAAQEVRKSLLKLAQSWPKDPLRPNLDFGEAIRRATETELSGPQARSNVAEARKSLAALERIRSSESLREVRASRFLPLTTVSYSTQYHTAGFFPALLYTARRGNGTRLPRPVGSTVGTPACT